MYIKLIKLLHYVDTVMAASLDFESLSIGDSQEDVVRHLTNPTTVKFLTSMSQIWTTVYWQNDMIVH